MGDVRAVESVDAVHNESAVAEDVQVVRFCVVCKVKRQEKRPQFSFVVAAAATQYLRKLELFSVWADNDATGAELSRVRRGGAIAPCLPDNIAFWWLGQRWGRGYQGAGRGAGCRQG